MPANRLVSGLFRSTGDPGIEPGVAVLETVAHTPFAHCLRAQMTPSDRQSDRKPRDLQTVALASGSCQLALPTPCLHATSSSSAPTRVAAVANGGNPDSPGIVIDQVENAIGAPACRPRRRERCIQRLTDPSRILQQRPRDEHLCRPGDLRRQRPRQRPDSRTSDFEPVGRLAHFAGDSRPDERIARSRPSASTTSPAWIAARPSRWARNKSLSPSTAIVSRRAS